MTPDIDKMLEKFNRIGKECWLGVSARRLSFDPPRSPDGSPLNGNPEHRTSMDRFVFMGDCFTSLDGKISPDLTGFEIIYNAHQKGHYLEDGAFYGPAWEAGTFVTWELFELALEYYVKLANSCSRTYFQGWPPKALYPDSAESVIRRTAERADVVIALVRSKK